MPSKALRAAAWALAAAALLAGCIPSTPVDLDSAASTASARIDAFFISFDRAPSPGVAVMVIRDGEVLHQRGYGLANLETGEPITPSSTFRLASVSKHTTAVAVMKLVEAGALTYDDPVVEHLPELARYGDELTLRHLLHHTGGLPDYYDAFQLAPGAPWPTNAGMARFLSGWGEPLFAPGEAYRYSNPGYEMLALVVERASGMPFSRFMEERVFGPVGMESTRVFDERSPELLHRALGYARSEGSGFELFDEDPLNHLTGSGGVYSNLEDLYRWDQALYLEGADAVLSPASFAEALTPARLADGTSTGYGFAWRIGDGDGLGPRIAHAGGWVGFSTYYLRYPERRFSVVLLSNWDQFDGGLWADRITDLYFPSRLIAGATLVDGTGAPARSADVRIREGRIAEIADSGKLTPAPGEPVVEAGGLVLAPGFIDTHSHADADIFVHPEAEALLSQGVTTAITGQDGSSRLPLRRFFARLEKEPAAVHLASFAGHSDLRGAVMGEDFERPATAAEIEAMRALLREELAAGALGLSTGLEYDPGIYSTTEELIALAGETAAAGGRYISHIRSEDRAFWEAIDEALAIGREAGLPVQISHLKLALRSLHGQTDRLLATLDAARAEGIQVTADLYPYTYWQSTLTVLFPERNFYDAEAARYAVEEVTSPEGMLLADYEPEPALAGRTLAAIAAERGTDPATTLSDLIRSAQALRESRGAPANGESDSVESVIAVSMTEGDIEALLAWPEVNLCTDGELAGSHPRGYGSFTRFLGRYVRERGVLSLEAAVHRMSGLAARHMGIEDRGVIVPGAWADLVLFDPERVADRATTEDPHALSEGVVKVWVNGGLAWTEGRATSRRAGVVIRRP